MKDLNVTMGYVYFYLTGITSVLSILGSIIIILTYAIFKDLRTSGRKLLAFLSVADLLTALGNFTGIMWYIYRDHEMSPGEDPLCKFHGALTIFSSISSFLWTVAIGAHLYLAIIFGNNILTESLVIPVHLLCWIVPGVVAVVAVALNVIGHDEELRHPSWCWVDPLRDDALFWQYVTGKAWEIAAYIAVLALYTAIKCFLIKQMKKWKADRHLSPFGGRGHSDVISSANRHLTFVPLVFIVARIWGTIRFLLGAHVHEYAGGAHAVWIVPLQGIGDSVQGFANCVLFCTCTPKIRRRIWLLLTRCSAIPYASSGKCENQDRIASRLHRDMLTSSCGRSCDNMKDELAIRDNRRNEREYATNQPKDPLQTESKQIIA